MAEDREGVGSEDLQQDDDVDQKPGAVQQQQQQQQKEKKPWGFVALDIETTGANMFDDEMFAVGWAYGSGYDDVVTGKCILNLKKPAKKTWEFFWNQRGWESRCWQEFWSKNEETLNLLQMQADCDNADDMAARINDALKSVESAFEKYTVVTDTLAFDIPWINALLYSNTYAGLGYRRDGSYNRGIGGLEVDSYLMGIYGLDLTDLSQAKEKPWLSDPYYVADAGARPPHDHDPENDAKNILYQFFNARDAASRKRKREGEDECAGKKLRTGGDDIEKKSKEG